MQVLHGLIPAHAGKTSGPSYRVIRPWAHPRSRGENVDDGAVAVASYGSSPLTRGKRSRNDRSHPGPGLIPAHAGKTGVAAGRCRPCWAHPRSRGENDVGRSCHVPPAGSSPLTRGKPGPAPHAPSPAGLIPAHAGKTGLVGIYLRCRTGSSPLTRGKPRCRGSLRSRAGVHPRSRGENSHPAKLPSLWAGSSPLTRGKRSGTAP